MSWLSYLEPLCYLRKLTRSKVRLKIFCTCPAVKLQRNKSLSMHLKNETPSLVATSTYYSFMDVWLTFLTVQPINSLTDLASKLLYTHLGQQLPRSRCSIKVIPKRNTTLAEFPLHDKVYQRPEKKIRKEKPRLSHLERTLLIKTSRPGHGPVILRKKKVFIFFDFYELRLSQMFSFPQISKILIRFFNHTVRKMSQERRE